MACNIQQVAGDDHHVVVRSHPQQPVELAQAVVQIGDDQARPGHNGKPPSEGRRLPAAGPDVNELRGDDKKVQRRREPALDPHHHATFMAASLAVVRRPDETSITIL